MVEFTESWIEIEGDGFYTAYPDMNRQDTEESSEARTKTLGPNY